MGEVTHNPPAFYDYDFGITCIDTLYGGTGHTACYLVVHNDRAAFIDTGTGNSVPRLLEVLKVKGVQTSAVKYVIPTHVHLDHAGGAGALMSELPNASLVIHPRGARHMVDPGALVASATTVYGEGQFKQKFGEVVPVDEGRVIVAEDDATLTLAGRTLTFLDTPGHARHHFCVYDKTSEGVFSGDTFGLSYRRLDNGGAFILPTTTPVQFDPDAWQQSLTRILDYKPKNIYLTHFGRVTEIMRLSGELRDDIDRYAEIARDHANVEDRKEKICTALEEYLKERLAEKFSPTEMGTRVAFLRPDLELNAAGLDVWLSRAQRAA